MLGQGQQDMRTFLGLLAVSLLLALAACRSGQGQGVTPIPTATATPPTATTTVAPAGDRLTVPEVVQRLRPSVVHILTESATFGTFGQVVPSEGVGTGFIIDERGYIVTNNHVVVRPDTCDQPARRITVTLYDGRKLSAQVVGTDPATDLAVLKVEATGLAPAPLGSSAALQVGEEVVAIGNALDLPGGPSVTKGVVSAKGRLIQESECGVTIPDAIQTDAIINPGNSGGPLVNMRGEVVGITTAVIRGSLVEGLGFAIPIDLARSIIEELIAKGKVERAYLGILVVDVTPSLARELDLPVEKGVGVQDVVPGGPADRAGLRPGDIIVRIGGQEVDNSGELLEALRRLRPGQEVSVEFYRDGRPLSASVTLAARPR